MDKLMHSVFYSDKQLFFQYIFLFYIVFCSYYFIFPYLITENKLLF